MSRANIILNEAEQFARSFSAQQEAFASGTWTESATGTRVVHHYHWPWQSYYWYTPFWSDHCPRPPVDTCRNTGKKEESKNDNLVIGIVASVVALTASYFIGKDLAKMDDSSQKIEDLEGEENLGPKVQEVVNIQKKMLENEYSSGNTGAMLKGALTVSAVTTGAGAFFALPAVIVYGLVGAAASSAALIVRQGYTDADTTAKEDASRLLRAVDEARR